MARQKAQHGGARRGAGRKSIQPEDRRRNRLMIGLTGQEYTQLLAAASGVESAARYVREVLLRHVVRVRR